jgi:hypothetical protein
MRLITGERLSPLRARLIMWVLTVDVEYDPLAHGWRNIVRCNAQESSHLPAIQAPEVQQTAVEGIHCEETKSN